MNGSEGGGPAKEGVATEGETGLRCEVAAIRTVPPSAADRELATAYRRVSGAATPAHIYQVHSLNPAAMVTHGQLYKAVMFGESPLSRAQRELVATVVSVKNDCHY